MATPIDPETVAELMALGYVDSSVTHFEQDGVVVHDPELTHPGLNLYLSSHAAEAILMDMDGRTVHRWRLDPRQLIDAPPPPHHEGAWPPFWRKIHLLPGGDLLAIHEGYGVVRLDRHSKVLWFASNGAHHDLWRTAEGRLFVLARGLTHDPAIRDDGPILDDRVLELADDGTTIGSWSILSGLKQSGHLPLIRASQGSAGDPLHSNSIQVVSQHTEAPVLGIHSGSFIVSSRNLDAILCLEPRTGDITWILSGATSRQHSARLVDGTTMTIFDNASLERGSKAVAIDLRTNATIETHPTEPRTDLYSRCCGTTRRLPNGNSLTTFTEASIALETTADGRTVWEFRSPHAAVVGTQQGTSGARAMLYEVERVELDRVGDWLNSDPMPVGSRDRIEEPPCPTPAPLELPSEG